MANYGKAMGSMVIDLGLKDTAFRQGLTGVKQQTRYWAQEMKASMRIADQFGSRVDKLKSKQTGLNNILEVQRKELELLKQRYKESYDETGKAGKKTLDYAREIRRTEQNLANYEIQLKHVSKELQLATSRGFKFGESLEKTGNTMQSFGKYTKSFGNSLTNNITKPLLGVSTALAGITFAKGFKRLKDIDTAKAKLKGLRYEANDVEKIMESALESVKGTSYGMGEAATIAASAVATGIKPGKELTRYLSLTADAAGIAGTSLEEMGPIFNKAQTKGKAYNEELRQLSERGLPIYQWLAEEAKVSAEEVFEMAKNGEISSEMLLNAVENNIGGAAKEMGRSSFSAVLENIWASVGRIGANFLDAGGKGGGFFSTIKPMMEDMLDGMGKWEEKAADLGVAFGEFFKKTVDKAIELKNAYQGLSDGQKDFVKYAGLTLVFGGPVLKFFGGFVEKAGLLTSGLGSVAKKMAEFSAETSFVTGESSKLAKVVGKAKTGLPEFGTNVMKFLVAPFKSFGRAVLHPVKSTKLLFSTLSGGLLNVKTLFSSGFLVLKGFFSGISSGIMTLLTQGISFSGVFNGIVGIFGALVNPVTITIGLFAALAGGILYLNKQTGSFSETFKLLKESITNFFKTVYNDYIAPALEEVTEAFKKSFETIKEFWNEYGQQFLDALTNFFSFVWAMIQPALGFWTGIFKSTFSTIVSLVKVSWDLVKGLFSGAFKVIGGLIKIFTGVFTGDWETMWNGVKDVAKGSWNIIATGFEAFVNAFLSVAEGLSNGITKGIVGAVNGVIKAVSWILDKFGLDKLKEWEVGEIKIKRVTLPKFAKGSGGLLMDTLGVVNDQKGSNYREMIIPPKGEPFIPRGRDVVLPMQKGTQIVPASITKEFTDSLPHFKKGTGGLFRNVWEGTKNTVGKLWGKVKDFTGNIMDYFDKPKELVQYAVNKFTNIPELPSFWLDMAHGAVKHTSSKAVGFVKSKFEDFMSSSNFIGDDSIGSNGVYSYLMDIARSLMHKYNMVFTSGFRPGDPYDHGKGLAVDIALPGVVNGSPIYQAAAEDAIRMPGVKYVITNGKWKHKGKSWVPWPDGDHYDHVHISGEKPVKSSYGGTGVDRWRETVVRALQITGQYSPANVNRTLYQMKTESGGNPRAINNWDINAKNGTPSKGLMQVIDPTFRAYAKAPFNKDIYDPLSNIIASIRYATSRYGSLAAAYRGTGYENGGLVNRHQIAQIAEDNKPEMIIPLTKKTRAVELINKAKSIIGMENGSVVVNNDTERLEALVAKQADMVESMSEKMIALLEVIAQKELTIDDESFNRHVNGGQGMLLKKNLVRG